MIKTTIKNTPVYIIDNAVPKPYLDNIQKWLKHKASFRNCYKESQQSKHVHFGMPITQGMLQQEFQLHNWFTNILTQYQPRATLTQVKDAHIPVFSKGSKPVLHRDFDNVNEETFFVACTLFLNPDDKDKNSGLFIEETYFNNAYNRMIVHSGHLNHKVRVPDNDSLRITLDIHVSNAIMQTNQTYENSFMTFVK